MERILSHYSEDFRMSSPLIVARTGRADGVIERRDAVARYWAPSLELDPPLRFELIDVLAGVERLTLYYDNVGRRRVAESLTSMRNSWPSRAVPSGRCQRRDP